MARTLLIFLLSVLSLAAQENDKTRFSDALRLNIDAYNQRVDDALELGELDFAKSLLDTFVKTKLQGSYMDPLQFERFDSGIASTAYGNTSCNT